MKFLNFIELCIIAFIAWQTWQAQKDFDALMSKQNDLQIQVDKLTTGLKSLIEAEAENCRLDSTFQWFHGNVWVTRDKFLLDKQAQASSNKANNFQQALESFGKIDSALIQSKVTFTTEETQAKPQVSFKK